MKKGIIHNPVATNKYLLQRKLKQFEKHLCQPILDIGAGFGQYTSTLREQGFVVDCIEPDASVRNPNLDYIIRHEHYNTGLLINVLHHVKENLHDFLTRYLHQCDLLIIGELNTDSWLVRNYHKVFVRDEIGLHFSIDGFKELLSDFEIIDFWKQDMGLFPSVHLFAVITSRRNE